MGNCRPHLSDSDSRRCGSKHSDSPFMEIPEKVHALIAKLKHSNLLFEAYMMQSQRLSKLHLRLASEQGKAVARFIQNLPSQLKPISKRKELKEASKETARALVEYLGYLKSRMENAPGQIAPQRHQLERILQELWAMDVPVEDLKKVSEEQFEI